MKILYHYVVRERGNHASKETTWKVLSRRFYHPKEAQRFMEDSKEGLERSAVKRRQRFSIVSKWEEGADNHIDLLKRNHPEYFEAMKILSLQLFPIVEVVMKSFDEGSLSDEEPLVTWRIWYISCEGNRRWYTKCVPETWEVGQVLESIQIGGCGDDIAEVISLEKIWA